MEKFSSRPCPQCGAPHPAMATWDESIMGWTCRACGNNEMVDKAGIVCGPCGGQVMPRQVVEESHAVSEVWACRQCGREPFITPPSSQEIAHISKHSAYDHRSSRTLRRPKAPTSGYAGPPERAVGSTFTCALAGCEVISTRRHGGEGVYCSRACAYEDRRGKGIGWERSELGSGGSAK